MDKELYLFLDFIFSHFFLIIITLLVLSYIGYCGFTIIQYLLDKRNSSNLKEENIVIHNPIEKTLNEHEIIAQGVIMNIVTDNRDKIPRYYAEIVYYLDNQEFKQLLTQEIPPLPQYKNIPLHRKAHLLVKEGDKVNLVINRYNLRDIKCTTFESPEDDIHMRDSVEISGYYSDDLKEILIDRSKTFLKYILAGIWSIVALFISLLFL